MCPGAPILTLRSCFLRTLSSASSAPPREPCFTFFPPIPMRLLVPRILALAAVGLGTVAATPLSTTRVSPTPRESTRAVAVLDFDNHSGEEKYRALGKGLAAMMITDLGNVAGIQLVEREHLQDLVEEQKLQRTALFDSTTATRVGKLVGADYVVVGALTAVDPQLRIDTRVLNVETGEIVKTASVRGPEDRFFALQEKLADELIDGLDVALSPEEMERLRAEREANRIDDLQTVLAYSEALALFDQENYVDAALKMQGVARAAPKSALVAITYRMMEKRAADEGKKSVKKGLNRFLRGRIP